MNCILCGNQINAGQNAFYEDEFSDDVWHLDCEDINGSLFGFDGMPTRDTEGTLEIKSRKRYALDDCIFWGDPNMDCGGRVELAEMAGGNTVICENHRNHPAYRKD